jgi:hypothetical protein
MPVILPRNPRAGWPGGGESTNGRPLLVGDYDLKQLAVLGITEETICDNQLYTEDGALWFPYRDLNGDLNGFSRRRLHNPLGTKDGKFIRYLQPKGTPLRAYWPVQTLRLLAKGTDLLYITEGEKKALLLAQNGCAAVGIGGIWCGCKPKTTELIDDLADLDIQGLAVYIVFDYDPKPRRGRRPWRRRSDSDRPCWMPAPRRSTSSTSPPAPTRRSSAGSMTLSPPRASWPS